MMDTWTMVMSMMRLLHTGFEVNEAVSVPLRTFAIQLLETTYGPSIVPAMAAFDMTLLLPRITTETLVTTSENDLQAKHFDALMAGIAGARGKMFPVVHPLHDIGRPERATEYAEAVAGFLLP